MQVRWVRSPPRVAHVVGRGGAGVLCVFALWCMGTLALTSPIRTPRWRRRNLPADNSNGLAWHGFARHGTA